MCDDGLYVWEWFGCVRMVCMCEWFVCVRMVCMCEEWFVCVMMVCMCGNGLDV